MPTEATSQESERPNPQLWQMLEQAQGAVSIAEYQYQGPLMPGQEFQLYMQAWPQAGEKIFELAESISMRTHIERMDNNQTARFVFRSFTLLGLGFFAIIGVVVIVLLATGYQTGSIVTALVAGALGVIREWLSFGRTRRDDRAEDDSNE